MQVAHDQRLIEAELLANHRDLLFRSVLGQQDERGIAGQMDHQEHDDGDGDQADKRVEQSLEDVSDHVRQAVAVGPDCSYWDRAVSGRTAVAARPAILAPDAERGTGALYCFSSMYSRLVNSPLPASSGRFTTLSLTTHGAAAATIP